MSESAVSRVPRPGARRRRSPLSHLARRAVHARLRSLRDGYLLVWQEGREEGFGDPESPLRARLEIRDPAFYRAVALRGTVGAAEAWMDGHWRSDDPVAVVRVIARNRDAFARLDGGAARLARPGLRLWHALRRNHRRGSRRNIAAHYDLGNDFFELFLDPTLTYSCGIFERDGAPMEEASLAKYERACRKLALRPEDRVLEIGGGWGGFALHAAGRYGCHVTTTTISRAQYERARERVAEAGLADRVEVLLDDYRDLRGTYDKLVSIEMIEAVGYAHLDDFFRACSERLAPDGAMFLQAIGTLEQDYEQSARNVDFVKRYIFPGGQLVSVGAVCGALARKTDLRVAHLEDITAHYAETLRRWRAKLFENRDAVRALGLPETFLRMWSFYLAYCEGGFRERAITAFQMLLEKPDGRRDWVRTGA